jgi:predicted RNA-binding protein associated with RNAse of E/G family
VTEIKRRLDGTEARFSCALLGRSSGWAALRYVVPAPVTVGGLRLPAGTETVGHYWTDRPYTAYHWLDRDGRTLGVYLNAASDVEIGDHFVRWQDLALDVLVTGHDHIEVLDDDEARLGPAWAQQAIAAARAHLLSCAVAIAAEVEGLTVRVRSTAPPDADRRKSP